MTDLLLDMVKHLTDNDLVLGDGEDTFRDFQPPEPDSIVVLNEYAGLPQGINTDCGVRSVQLVVRDVSSDTAKQRIWQIVNLLIKPVDPIQRIGTRWLIISLRGTPFRLTTDTLNRVVWCVNLGITTQNEY
jgi:hypothetical protein